MSACGRGGAQVRSDHLAVGTDGPIGAAQDRLGKSRWKAAQSVADRCADPDGISSHALGESDGKIYNPEDARTDDATMRLQGPDTLIVEGCVLFIGQKGLATGELDLRATMTGHKRSAAPCDA
jgi:hypothetical protein